MTADPRTDLFIPNKQNDYGDNWRALEFWSSVVWADIPLVGAWGSILGEEPKYAVDGFGMLHLSGGRAIIGTLTVADLQIGQIPVSSAPRFDFIAATTAITLGGMDGSGNPTPAAFRLQTDGKIFLLTNLPDPTDVVIVPLVATLPVRVRKAGG